MGIFDKIRRRGSHDRFHEAMLAAEQEAEPLRRWLVQEVDALDPKDAAWQSRLAGALVEKVRYERVSLEAMMALLGSVTAGLVLSNTDERDILASHVVTAAFDQLKGPTPPQVSGSMALVRPQEYEGNRSRSCKMKRQGQSVPALDP